MCDSTQTSSANNKLNKIVSMMVLFEPFQICIYICIRTYIQSSIYTAKEQVNLQKNCYFHPCAFFLVISSSLFRQGYFNFVYLCTRYLYLVILSPVV